MKLKAAIVGAGLAGQDHGRRLGAMEHIQLVAGVDVDLSVAQGFCRAYGGRPYTDICAMAKDQCPDLVIVASSNQAHAENVVAATESGIRNIYCEKPLCIDIDDAVQMVQAVEKRGVRTSMGFAGCDATYSRVVELAHSGRLGRILSVHLETYRGYGFWGRERTSYRGVKKHHAAVERPEISGGWTIHHACHQVFVLSKIGGPVKSAYGRTIPSSPSAPSEELISATLQFENGAVGSLIDSIGSFRGSRCSVIGTLGTLLMQDDSRKEPGNCSEIRLRLEGEDEDYRELVQYEPHAQSRLKQFIDVIRSNEPSPITFREGLENLLVCQAIRDSSDSATAVEITPLPTHLLSR